MYGHKFNFQLQAIFNIIFNLYFVNESGKYIKIGFVGFEIFV
jgi:hypothetical protein